MKFLIATLIFLSFLSCATHKKIVTYIPLEYNFPDIKVGENRTYVYVDQTNDDSSFHNFYRFTKNGKTYFSFTSSTGQKVSDSIIYLNGKVVEDYSYLFDKPFPTNAEILLDTIIDTGKKFGKQITQVNFNSDSLTDSIKFENEFLKDTVFTWKGNILPTIEINSILYTAFKSKIYPNVQKEYTIPLIYYLAKGVGLVRIKILKTTDNKSKYINLVDVRE